ncbi:MAG: outer membrane beta-barrel protein, partial [Gemmataceae bacterium]
MGITSLLLTSVAAVGQVPMVMPADAAAPAPFVLAQAAQGAAPAPMPMPVPMSMPKAPMGTLPPMAPMANAPMMTAPMAAPAAAPGVPCAACEAAKAEEPAPAATKYFLEKLLEGSAAGQLLSDRGITIQGWTEMSYNISSTSKDNNPTTFTDRANAFQMNQTWLDIAKSIDTSKKETQFGFRASTFYGTDYRFTLPRGLWNRQLERNNYYGVDPVYAYGEIFLPGLGGEGTTLRVGRWGTLIGYEVIDAVNTPFVTKSYNFQYNPFTHTGVMATTQLNS